MTRNKILALIISLCPLFPFSSQASGQKCVILIHGLARSHTCMSKLEAALKRHDYFVVNRDYPSTSRPIKELVVFIPPMIDECIKRNVSEINFVTHSLGGIILQEYLQNHKIAKLERIIMLSPPNHGSPIADILHNNWLYRVITGPAGQELTTCKHSIPNRLHLNADYQIGIITGTFNYIPFGYYLFNEENDGAVSVSSAKTSIMKDFITFPSSHSFIMDNSLVQKQIIYFLNHGKFMHDGSQSHSNYL